MQRVSLIYIMHDTTQQMAFNEKVTPVGVKKKITIFKLRSLQYCNFQFI